MSSQGGGSQPPGSSQAEDKVWRLQDGTMEVVAAGKKSDKAMFMSLDLLFKLEDQQNSQVVEILYNEDSLKKAWNQCCNALDTIIFIEDCSYKQMKEAFIEFIHQEYREFKSKMKEQASQGLLEPGSAGASSVVGKQTKHFSEPAVEKFGENYYFIGYDVFNLGKPGSPLEDVRKMTSDEVKELPVTISWSGPKLDFETDFEQCFTRLADILYDYNPMQPRKYVSFGLAVIVFHMAGQIYPHIIDHRTNFCTQMSVSGPATATGKSLMQTVCMMIFTGSVQSTTTSLTEATMYEQLGKENIYVREFTTKKSSSRSNSIDPKFLNVVIPALFERNERRVMIGQNAKVYKLNHVMHIDANILPSDLKKDVTGPNLDKLMLNYTGSVPLSHPDMDDLIEAILKNAKECYKFLPVMMKLAIEICLPRASPAEMEDLAGDLKRPGDKRGGQTLAMYGRLYGHMKDAIEKYGLRKAILFESEGIDRRSLIAFNTDTEEQERVERVIEALIVVVKSNPAKSLVEFSERTSCFKVKTSDPGSFPVSLALELKKCKSSSTTFGGKTQRVVIISVSAMEEVYSTELRALCCRYDQWYYLTEQEDDKQWDHYGEEFYARGHHWGDQERDLGLMEAAEEIEDGKDKEIDLFDDNNNTGDDLKCDNPYCGDFEKDFKFVSRKRKHDQTAYHRDAKAPKPSKAAKPS